MKRLWQMPLMALFAVFALVSFTFTVNAAEKLPYEYDFKVTNATYNGFKGVKEMVVTFEKDIPTTFNKDKIKLYQGNNEVPNVIRSVTGTGKQVTITFENLEFLNPSGEGDSEYQIVIGKDANVVTAQLSAYTLPFKLHEILPGFSSIFVEGSSTTINNNIFKQNATYDVSIHVPTAYLTKIETIHRYSGVTQQTNEPNLTNIDVFADPGATRMKAWLGNQYDSTHENSRDLDYRADIKGFSMGQAGIDALVCSDGADASCEQVNDFHLRAYDQYGKVLTNRSFKIRVNNKEADFKINDYIKSPAKVFGTTETLYNLMANQKLLEDILTQIPVEELDKLGVTYSLGNSIEVKNEEQLLMALANDHFKTIVLAEDIDLNGTLSVNRNVTIKGGKFVGDVVLGDGTNNLIVRLQDTTISGDLTIDVGNDGTAILDNVNVDGPNGTLVKSGGIRSIHLRNFVSVNGIVVDNVSPVRIVTATEIPEITLASTEKVTLEGAYQEVNVVEDTHLTMTNNTEIGGFNVDNGKELTVTYPSTITLPGNTGPGNLVEDKVQVDSPKPIIEGFIETTGLSGEGVDLDFEKFNDQFGGKIQIGDVDKWELDSTQIGDHTAYLEKNDVGYVLKVTGEQSQSSIDIVLIGEDQDRKYRLTISFTITS